MDDAISILCVLCLLGVVGALVKAIAIRGPPMKMPEIEEASNVAWLRFCRDNAIEPGNKVIQLIFKMAFAEGVSFGSGKAFDAASEILKGVGK